MKQKVLYIITKSNWGGAQRYVYDLTTNLPPDTYEVVVALGGTGLRNADVGSLSKKLSEKGIRTVHVSHFMRDMSPINDLGAFFEVLSLVQKEQPDIIHANSSKAGGIGMVAGFFAGVRTRVFTVHGFAFNEQRSTVTTVLIRLASWFSLLFATHAICVSKTDADIASRWFFVGKKIHHIPVGIAPFPLLETEQARNALLENAPRTNPWLGSIAELHQNKGLDYAIEACALLRDRGSTFVYVIIGGGEEEMALRALIQKLHLETYVYLVGYKPEAATYLRAFDVYVLSSKKEGMPYTLLESGYAGSAVVTSDIPALLSIVRDNETALVAHMHDRTNNHHIISLADTLGRLIENQSVRSRVANLAKEIVIKEYSLDIMVQKTVELYS